MRIAWVAGLLATLVATAAWADADEPFGIRVDVRGTTATVTASYKLEVEAKTRQAFTISKPDESVVIAGTVSDASGKHPMKLVRAEEATAAFDVLMKARGPAQATLVQLSEQAYSHVNVETIAPKATTLTLNLTFELSTTYEGEQRRVALPTFWVEKLPAALKRRIVKPGNDRGEAAVLAFAAPIARARSGPHVAINAARFSDGKTQAARVEIALAKTLTDVPADLKTVFVIDTSRSMTAGQRDAARAVVRSYLAHAPRSSVQIVTFARTATALRSAWTAASAARVLDKELAKIAAKNGSEVQVGLREAGSWLARVKGTRRLVLISDERVADRVAALSTETLAKELPADTLFHTVGVSDSGGLYRHDETRWGALAAATGGIGAGAGIDEHGNVDALELVRPIALDGAKIRAAGWRRLEGDDEPTRLDEGTALEWWGGGTTGDAVEIEGLLWNKRWSQTVALGDRGNISIARQLRFVLATGDALAVAALDASKSLNERWSMISRWGGKGGYGDEPGGGGTGWGTICDDCGFGDIGHGSGTGSGSNVHEVTPLKVQLYEAVSRCTRDDVKVALTVETTLNEIVDVAAKATGKNGAPADAAQIETCVVEGVWATNIRFSSPRSHAIHKLTY